MHTLHAVGSTRVGMSTMPNKERKKVTGKTYVEGIEIDRRHELLRQATCLISLLVENQVTQSQEEQKADEFKQTLWYPPKNENRKELTPAHEIFRRTESKARSGRIGGCN